jgi:hypothetical protein
MIDSFVNLLIDELEDIEMGIFVDCVEEED